MIQNKWTWHVGDDVMKVPPPSPQDASMLETVFSTHTKTHDAELHARELNGLLLNYERRTSKRSSRIPVLSCRIIHKKKNQGHYLSKAFERISLKQDSSSMNKHRGLTIMKKDKIMDKIVQELKDMGF